MIDLDPFRENVDRAGVHPNGPVVLIRNREDGGEDRVHWWRKDHFYWSNVHNHRWSFDSVCLYGELEEDMVLAVGNGGLRNEINGTMTDLGPMDWFTQSTARITPGPSRHLDINQFHRVKAISETVTYVQTEPIERSWSIILPGNLEEGTRVGPFVAYNESEVQDAIDSIEGLLNVGP